MQSEYGRSGGHLSSASLGAASRTSRDDAGLGDGSQGLAPKVTSDMAWPGSPHLIHGEINREKGALVEARSLSR